MNLIAFITILLGLQIVCLIIGRQSSKDMQNQEDYFLAGKGIRFFPLMMTFLATQIGGGLVLGSAEEAYQFGWSVLFYPLGASLGLIVLGLGIGRRLAQFQVSTIAQIFEVVYGSPRLKKIASLLSILSLFMILIAQFIASHKFMISLGVESTMWFICFWGIVIVYTSLGGLKAVVATDVVQALFFIAVFLFSFGYVAYFNELPTLHVAELGLKSENFAFDSSKLYGWLLMPLLFMVIEQDMGQRCFAAISPSTVSKATLWAAICTLIVSVIPVFFGILAKSLNLEIPAGASVLMTTIVQTTNPLIAALMACAILAAIISTADSLINAVGSNLSQDFGLSFLVGKNMRTPQAISAGIAIMGLFFSFYFNNIVNLLIQSYELSVSCLFIPIFIAIFKKQGHALSASLAVFFGALGFFFFKIVPSPELPKEILSILFSFLGYCAGEVVLWMGVQQTKKKVNSFEVL
jgi:solute:Na+ symporter, SSS family